MPNSAQSLDKSLLFILHSSSATLSITFSKTFLVTCSNSSAVSEMTCIFSLISLRIATMCCATIFKSCRSAISSLFSMSLLFFDLLPNALAVCVPLVRIVQIFHHFLRLIRLLPVARLFARISVAKSN